MQSALWKIAALVSVISIGGFVVFKVHDQLQLAQQSGTSDPNKFKKPDADGPAPGATVELGPDSGGDPFDTFDLPPDNQSEPGGSGESMRFAADDDRQPQLRSSTPAGDGSDPSNPFFLADAPEADAETAFGPADFGNSTFDEFPAETGSEATALTTADARLTAGPPDGVEQVGAARTAPPAESHNPFSGFGSAIEDEQFSADAGATADFGELVVPTEPNGPVTADASNPPGEPSALPELSFDQTEPGPAGNPFGGATSEEIDAEGPVPVEATDDLFGPGFGTLPADDAGPGFDLGEPATPESELVLPEDEPATTALPPATFPSGPATGLRPEAALAPRPAPAATLEPTPTSAIEPSRLPNVPDDSGLPRTAVRTPGLSPVTPLPANPLPEVRPLNPDAVPGSSGTGRPEFVGDGTLGTNAPPSGPQQPELTIQKLAPPDATVGDPLVYAIKVKNVGNSTAHDVIVEDKIPRGTTLEGSIPQAELVDKKLIWQLGHMQPGDEKTIRIKVVPTEPGEVGSVATVRFVAEVAATTRITTPNLTMDVSGPGEVAVGEQVVFHFRISNVGDGEARNVYIRNLLPDGFQHPGGKDIEYDVGSLKPGDSRAVDLAVTAAQEGSHSLRAQLNTGTTVRDETNTPVNVIKSRLLIQRQGPKRRFVGRPAEYTTLVSNRSSSPLQRIEVVEKLAAGMELSAAPEGGHFDPQRRTITWRIAELPAGGVKTLKTSVISSQQGVLRGSVTAVDAAGNQAQLTSQLEVAGFASLKVDLEHDGRPVGVGESVAMQLTVKNRGTGTAEHVEALFDIPDHLEFVNAEGPVQFEQQGRTVKFAAIEELAANEERTFKIMLMAAAPGNTPVTAQLTTAALEGPLQQAEAVIVEADGQ